VILQEGDGPTVIPTLAKKITSELAEVNTNVTVDILILVSDSDGKRDSKSR